MTNNYPWGEPGRTEQWHKIHNTKEYRMNLQDNWDDENDFLEDEELSVTDENFESLDDILCETCGEPAEYRHLLEDTDYGTVLQVCANCLQELAEEEPDRWVIIEE